VLFVSVWRNQRCDAKSHWWTCLGGASGRWAKEAVSGEVRINTAARERGKVADAARVVAPKTAWRI
jgi:hypothetical protein